MSHTRHLVMYEAVFLGFVEVHLAFDILSCARFEENLHFVEVYSTYVMYDGRDLRVRWLVKSQGVHKLKYTRQSKRPCGPSGKG